VLPILKDVNVRDPGRMVELKKQHILKRRLGNELVSNRVVVYLVLKTVVTLIFLFGGFSFESTPDSNFTRWFPVTRDDIQ
jgi:hypothetical protein